MNKRIVFEIVHPKHFYQFRPLIEKLKERNKIQIIAREKDVVPELLDNFGYNYYKYGFHGKNIFTKILALPLILYDYFKILKIFKPDIIISRSSPYSIFFSKYLKIKSIVFPDSDNVVPLINHFIGPYADLVITPSSFGLDFGHHHFRIDGLFEETYLSPKIFSPDVEKLFLIGVKPEDVYFIVRFVGWHAHHDVYQKSFTVQQKIIMIKKLEKMGKVFISSEVDLPDKLMKYKLQINPSDIHTILYFASLYIGDSQTMATEAALLGTPSIRFNSFVGENDMSNFIMLEKDYGLIKNISSYIELDMYLDKCLVEIKNLKLAHQKKSKRYFDNKSEITNQSLVIITSFMKDILKNIN